MGSRLQSLHRRFLGERFLYGVFFASGFPALLYQLVWQRKLFTVYGVNIESITVVVTAFMLGLGLGALLGGRLSRLKGLHPLLTFASLELGIGLFGLISLPTFEQVATHTSGAPPVGVFSITFGLILLPTLLMGATLPVLVGFLVRRNRNVGRSVGILYFVNTLGSAAACILAASLIFSAVGLSGAIFLAAGLNIAISIGALAAYKVADRSRQEVDGSLSDRPTPLCPQAPPAARSRRNFKLALVLVGLAGFISLSYEILWARFFIISAGGHPKIFPVLLGFFLAGLAYGALLAHRYCRKHAQGMDRERLLTVAKFLFAANLAGFLVLPALAWSVSLGFPTAAALPVVALASAMLGAALPLLSHFGIAPEDSVGDRLSLVYLANILGSAGGSLVTGFVLMEFWSGVTINLALGLAGFLLCAGVALASSAGHGLPWRPLIGITGTALGMLALSPSLMDGFHERILFKTSVNHPDAQIDYLIENRSGVIAVTTGHKVFGGGVYDGIISTSLIQDRNKLFRSFALSALHPKPKQVLSIGIGSGSWAQVLAHQPDLERLTIIEINPGYVEMLANYPEVRSLLANPKVEIVVDDARRWLSANPDRKFDAVVQNTTFYWRTYSSNLLSREYFEKIRSHLNEGGLVYFNSTWSAVGQRTAATVFPYAYRFSSMMAVSDSPIRPNAERLRSTLLDYRIDGQPVLDPSDSNDRKVLGEVLARLSDRSPYSYSSRWETGLEDRESILTRTAGFPIATDDNMATEWVAGQTQENFAFSGGTWIARRQ